MLDHHNFSIPMITEIPRVIANQNRSLKWRVYRIWRNPMIDRLSPSAKPWIAVGPLGSEHDVHWATRGKRFRTRDEAVQHAAHESAKHIEATA